MSFRDNYKIFLSTSYSRDSNKHFTMLLYFESCKVGLMTVGSASYKKENRGSEGFRRQGNGGSSGLSFYKASSYMPFLLITLFSIDYFSHNTT